MKMTQRKGVDSMTSFADSAKWIWCNDHPQADEYGEFVDKFFFNGGEPY